MRSMMFSLAACTVLCAAAYAGDADSSAPVADDAEPDATVTLKGGSVAAGIGFGEQQHKYGPFAPIREAIARLKAEAGDAPKH